MNPVDSISPPAAVAEGEQPAQFAIVCQGLSKSYGEIQALVDLDLNVPYGSIFGFLGRNR
jgi:ABC-type sugar transport system ATPase subunit